MSLVRHRLDCVALLAALVAMPAAGAELVVEWVPPNTRVEAYQIERSSDDAGEEFKPVARVGGSETRFRDRAVIVGTRYCYRVRGVRGGRLSRPSAPLCNVASERVAAAEPAAAAEPLAGAEPVAPARGEDREIRALRRPPPPYPRQAQLNQISGWVKLIFTVAADGTTRDIRVTASEPPGVFDAAAIGAVARFVYLPRLENGVPVDRANVETEITFNWIDRGGALVTDPRTAAQR